MQLDDAFSTFHDKVSLGKKPEDRIQSATSSLSSFLCQAYGLPAAAVFLQGSYPNGTAVEPAGNDGEYDADLVCACAGEHMSADQALNDLEEQLASNGTYREMLKREGSRKKPCVRLRYADDEVGSFHVDIVPSRTSGSDDPQAPLEVPRRGEGWHDTAPAEYTAWCEAQGPQFARTVKMLKRWREENQPARHSIKSIVLQVLAATNLAKEGSDAEVLVATLSAIKSALDASPQTPPRISNPVLASENLAARWTPEAYANFRTELGKAVELASAALAESDEARSHDQWRALLGDDFPPAPSNPAKRTRVPPTTPAPGFHDTQAPPRRERYGR